MVAEKVTIQSPLGLHARPAGVFTKTAKQYESEVKMRVAEKVYNIKSIMGVLSAGVRCGTEIEIICSGRDEQEALRGMVEAVRTGLGE
jgi:phosphocarrier protein HPr